MFSFKGLSQNEVEASRRRHGSNQITPQEVETFWGKLGDNFRDPMIVILVIALIVVTVLAVFGFTEWYEGVGIAVAVVLATFVATVSEFKNEQTFQKLQEEASKIAINVFRDGSLRVVGIDDVVTGDIVLLQPGDKIPADGKIIRGKAKVNQAALTGEPEAVTKTPGDTDELNLDNPHAVYRGTIVEDGEAALEVQVVGDNTHLGKLAEALQTDERIGPLRVKLAKLADDIAMFGYIGASFIAVAFMFKAIYLDNGGDTAAMLAYVSHWQQLVYDIATALILAVIIIVVAVPEGLPMMIAIVLAQNMRKLLKSNVLVRQLMGVETSGSLNLLFSDKTGTITRGQLEAVGFMTAAGPGNAVRVNHYKSFEEMPPELARLLDISLRENTSCVVNCETENEAERILGGNTTERALLKFVRADISACIEEGAEMVSQVLFNSARKFSATRIRLNGGEITLIKGAPEILLERCSHHYTDDGSIGPLPEEEKPLISEEIDKKAEDGFRLIGVATKTDPTPNQMEELPEDLTLLGFALIRDDVREESKPAIETLQSAGIHVVMLTGDRSGTAKAIARDVGLLNGDRKLAIKSADMAKLSDEELRKMLPDLNVVSRCLPQDKTRLVKVAQEAGLVVGMTGDGVNDSPALSNADIGFGLGSGTEVAKEASDIVVLDDNIQSITNAVHYGRTIYRAIQKFITFQLTVNVSAIAIAFLGPFLGFKLPLTMIQLLWINLIMDTLAALAFSGEPPLAKHMREKPKAREEHLITGGMWSSILCNGMFMTLVCIAFLKLEPVRGLFHSEAAFMTAFFGVFVFLNNFNKFNVRVEEFNLFGHILENRGFLRVVGMIFVIQVLITYFGGEMFRTVPLLPVEWLYILGISIVIIPFDLCRKYICWIFE
ncbi:calcium-translocating P-type ATPase, PMCA-type [Desulfonema ishimotonii]|uniref:P-type Ca(2+) transporter n=1 Tax=Desulfonema ishimotonii TaxID=45657 RepID=A0A401G277_9BACT|nr:calcium-translocating P-type ATPase, PMCA-type [Desulfonema ishimotonii]GBC63306.1 calcium-translocating P-type ATPase, PMCA-type [Desulfonema ishimotonii]